MLRAGNILSKSNRKLGTGYVSFSLAAVSSCPGATSACKSVCYASKLEKVYTSAQVGWARRFNLMRDTPEQGEALLRASISKLAPGSTFRIHVSGDFFSSAYVMMWRRIVKAFPAIKFYAYTRSWHVQSMVPSLLALASLPNLQLFASMDETDAVLPHPLFRRAMMGDINGQAAPGTVLCPVVMKKLDTCADCNLCARPTKLGVTFPIHN